MSEHISIRSHMATSMRVADLPYWSAQVSGYACGMSAYSRLERREGLHGRRSAERAAPEILTSNCHTFESTRSRLKDVPSPPQSEDHKIQQRQHGYDDDPLPHSAMS